MLGIDRKFKRLRKTADYTNHMKSFKVQILSNVRDYIVEEDDKDKRKAQFEELVTWLDRMFPTS